MNDYDVVTKILRTEKSTELNETNNQYLFQVNTAANKIQIRNAVERIYKVKVKEVRTVFMPSKPKTLRREPGTTAVRKKAYVTLHKDNKIDLTV